MKLGNLLIVASLLIGSAAFAQEGEGEDRECTRLRVVANNALGVENWKEATEYFIRAEAYCQEFGKDNYDRLLASVQNMLALQEENSDAYYNYLDTLMISWENAEENGHYDPIDDISRGYYYTLLKTPNYVKADFYMGRGIKTQGVKIADEVYILLYYYNVYSLWYMEQDEEAKDALKQRYIKEYFELNKLINDANFSLPTQETLTQYLAQVITSCEDLLPAVPKYMDALPEDPAEKKTALMNFARLLIDQDCKDSDEFETMVEMLYELDPNDLEIQLLYLETLTCSEKIPVYKDIMEKTEDAEKKNEIQYNIAACYMQIGSYQAAFNAAKSVSGSLRSKALQIQAGCVASTANSCGDSTFERKCNYLYAAQLMEQAGLDGSKYKAAGPTSEDCFNNNSPSSVTLSCWGVTVNPCN